jgi:arsenical pump membrane protein
MEAFVALLALATTVGIALGWPHRAAPAVGGLAGVLVALVGGEVGTAELEQTARVLWRPLLTITAVMAMTTAARELGLFDRLAAIIEPYTRGPVRHAFRIVFVIGALSSAVLSNDAAVLVLTPAVLALLRTVYPIRFPRFSVPFAFAVFYAAGVAPLVVGNPMNLVVADRAGLGFNEYAVRMIPVAIAGWVTAYLVLARVFRDDLADETPAKGAWPPQPAVAPSAWLVVVALAAVLVAYPIVSFLDGPLWLVACGGALACTAAAWRSGIRPSAVAAGVSWEILPFLAGVLVVATALENAGVVDALVRVYRDTPAPLPTIAVVAALGSALLNNHPMALLGAIAIERGGGGTPEILASLVGGDLGPRLLPIGSLAGLLWLATLRRAGVTIPFGLFVRTGVIVTVPALAVSIAVLWVVTQL